MHHALFSVLFVFPFLSINARDFSLKGPTFYVMKGMNTPPQQLSQFSQADSDPTKNSFNPTAEGSNAAPPTTVPGSNQSANNTTTAIQAANNTQNAASSNQNAPTTSIPLVPAPEQAANSICHNSSTGKNVTFSDRACWHAAKALAEAGSSSAQCGTCVLGLFDADKKKMFKPPNPIAAAVIQEQAMKLLQECKDTAPKVSKRDTAPNPANNDSANVQLLMGFNEKPKECAGL